MNILIVKPTEINEILENGNNNQNIQSFIKNDDTKNFKKPSTSKQYDESTKIKKIA